jgi:Putative addiction module component
MARDPKDPPPPITPAWSKEIARRVREIDDGTAELVDWEDVRAELFADD